MLNIGQIRNNSNRTGIHFPDESLFLIQIKTCVFSAQPLQNPCMPQTNALADQEVRKQSLFGQFDDKIHNCLAN